MFKLDDTLSVDFSLRKGGPDRLAADAHLEWTAGALAGIKLVGFTVWTSVEGDHYVTLPSRSFGVGGERCYFDFLRSVEGNAQDVARLKGLILRAFEVWKRPGSCAPLVRSKAGPSQG